MNTTLLTNGWACINGREGRYDLAIEESGRIGRIASGGTLRREDYDRVINAERCVMAPGGVDGHAHLPFLGEVLFSYKPLTYVTILLAVLIHIYLYKTKLGLVHRSIGENPLVADTLGINVNLVRYGAVVACGVLCGISGAFMSLSNLNQFQNGMVSGRGFIAFAAVIFGGWSPFGVLGASVFFGLADAIQMRMQAMQTGISYHLLQCVPYLCTLVALVFARKSAACPASDGLPYRKEET